MIGFMVLINKLYLKINKLVDSLKFYVLYLNLKVAIITKMPCVHL